MRYNQDPSRLRWLSWAESAFVLVSALGVVLLVGGVCATIVGQLVGTPWVVGAGVAAAVLGVATLALHLWSLS